MTQHNQGRDGNKLAEFITSVIKNCETGYKLTLYSTGLNAGVECAFSVVMFVFHPPEA